MRCQSGKVGSTGNDLCGLVKLGLHPTLLGLTTVKYQGAIKTSDDNADDCEEACV
jgi:hypothetical protein